QYENMRAAWNDGKSPGCSPQAWKKEQEEAAKEDDVLIVSRGLNRLAKTDDLQAKKYLVRALQKWGTVENVESLIELTDAEGGGADEVRIGACKALARIPSQKGADAVAARLVSDWSPEVKGVTEALLAYRDKSQPEDAILGCLAGKVEHRLWPRPEHGPQRGPVQYDEGGKLRAIAVLAKGGSRKSYPAVNELLEDPRLGEEAERAIGEIRKRCKKAE